MERFNLDIEKAILGNCINSNETLVKVLIKGEKEDFYNTTNQKVFDSLLESYSTKGSTDMPMVSKTALRYVIFPVI